MEQKLAGGWGQDRTYQWGGVYNLITSATNGPMRLIAVVLGASSDLIRFTESEKLLNWGFRFFTTVVPITADKPFTTEKVWYMVPVYGIIGN